MYPELEELADLAEERYLTEQEMAEFKRHTTSLAQRLEVYETLRDRELEIFQPIADRLEVAFPDEEQTILEQALIHWLSVLRYSAMAMLANNKDFLRSQFYAGSRERSRCETCNPLRANSTNCCRLVYEKSWLNPRSVSCNPF